MKSIAEFLFYLNKLDIKVWADGDRLRCNAPKGRLTEALRAEIAERKEEILKFLHQGQHDSHSHLEVIQAVARNQNLPLSFAQQRLWFLDQLEENSASYNLPAAIHLKGQIQVAALNQAIQEIVMRHEVLRTTFSMVNGTPVQTIASRSNINLIEVDLSSVPNAEQAAEVERLATQEANRSFNLETDPLLRIALLHLAQKEQVLLINMHHIISDGWSMGIFVRELSTLYNAFCQGKPSPLPKLLIQYADFAVWQHQWLSREVLDTQLSYWKEQLARVPPILELPTDRPRPPVQTFRGSTQSFQLSKELTLKLKTLSQQSEATLFMTLLAAFATLLYRYSDQDDIVIGSPIANRNRKEIEPLIGFFVNTLVLRANLVGNPTFVELMVRVRQMALAAYNHQDLPFEKLVEALQPERNLSHHPLFQVMFVLQKTPLEPLELPGLTLTPLDLNNTTSKFDVTLSMVEIESGLTGTWEYNSDLFDATTIHRMIGHFQTLLEAIVANPQLQVSELSLITEAERHQLLVKWNDTQAEYPAKCIHQLFEEQVKRIPDAIALVFENQQLTYRELNIRANQLAHYLQDLGVGPEILVGICLERSVEMLVGILGILKAGGAYVPMDPAYPQERLEFMLSHTQMPVLLTQAQFVTALPSHTGKNICLDTDWNQINQKSVENPISWVKPENLIYVIYTSGSTGKPKGVQVLHQSVSNFLNSMLHKPGLRDRDSLLAVTTISFDIAVLELFLPLIVGARVVLVSREETTDGAKLLAKLIDSQATVMQATPATWRLLLAAGWERTPQLKILCGGEGLPKELAHQLLNKSNSVWNLYGPTEATVWSTVHQVEKSQSSESIDSLVLIGRPINNTQIHILDRNFQLLPIGVSGELFIGGDGLARGYLNLPELTEQKFISNPFSNKLSPHLYRTGDLARYLPDGNIELIGRIDSQVKIRGFRIELGEIEAILSQYPQVRETVVIAHEDQPSNKRLVAYVVAHQKSLTSSELRRFLKKNLPEYMIPSTFVLLEALPLTPNGKVDRSSLPIPQTFRPQLEAAYVMPQTESERLIAAVWQETLKLERVGIHDNFFELGGHSLLTVQIYNKLQEIFGQKLSIIEMFKYPTIYSLAQHLTQQHSERASDQQSRNRANNRSTRQGLIKQQRQVRQKHHSTNKY
ncbi:non-ribosomal peptide synthetase [Westiellopsis prolifica IICB1]|nr:non-ribosomal peptide synthetase [Westiellopsis prolifica IICB1]